MTVKQHSWNSEVLKLVNCNVSWYTVQTYYKPSKGQNDNEGAGLYVTHVPCTLVTLLHVWYTAAQNRQWQAHIYDLCCNSFTWQLLISQQDGPCPLPEGIKLYMGDSGSAIGQW